MDMDEGKLAARQVGLAILATLRANLGSLDRKCADRRRVVFSIPPRVAVLILFHIHAVEIAILHIIQQIADVSSCRCWVCNRH